MGPHLIRHRLPVTHDNRQLGQKRRCTARRSEPGEPQVGENLLDGRARFKLGFRKPGVKATSRAAFTRYYESEVLRPMRYTMRYEMGQSQLRKSMSAAATTLGMRSIAAMSSVWVLAGACSASSSIGLGIMVGTVRLRC